MGLILLNVKTGVIFLFFSLLKGMGGAEPFLATSYYNIPTYTENTETALKVWNF